MKKNHRHTFTLRPKDVEDLCEVAHILKIKKSQVVQKSIERMAKSVRRKERSGNNGKKDNQD